MLGRFSRCAKMYSDGQAVFKPFKDYGIWHLKCFMKIGSYKPPDSEFLVNNLFFPDLSTCRCSEQETLKSS